MGDECNPVGQDFVTYSKRTAIFKIEEIVCLLEVNQGVCTINLPNVALTSGKNEELFWQIFDERLEMCHKVLRLRHEHLLGTKSDMAPILWQHGAFTRLKSGEIIDDYLYGAWSTISLGYAGLYECVYYMKGVSHTDPSATDFAMKVMQKLNDKCKEWRAAENIAYSVYGTPIETLTYKFAKANKKMFGVIEGVTDKNYVTNSYHVPVTEEIDPFEKITFEAPFQALSPGGAVSYIEATDIASNIPAVMTMFKHFYDHILYAEINSKFDYCHECGYSGEINVLKDEESGKWVWECPNCGNRDQHKMNVARRTCGLTIWSTLNRLNCGNALRALTTKFIQGYMDGEVSDQGMVISLRIG